MSLTADARERRIVQYLLSVRKERIQQFRLIRMNRKSNLRKRIIQLIDEAIQECGEEFAAALLEEYATPRPKNEDVTDGRLVLPVGPKKAQLPPWVRKSGESAG